MLICLCDICFSTNVILLAEVFTLKRCFLLKPINLVVEEISRNKPFVQTLIIYFINQTEKHVSIQHYNALTLMKSGAPFFRVDIIYMIYYDVKYFSVVYLSIIYEKLAVKTTLTTMRYFFAKKLNFCPSDITWNSIALKCKCLKHISKFDSCFLYIQHVLTRNKFTSFRPWKLETLTLFNVTENLHTNILRTIISSLANKSYYYIVILFRCYVFRFSFEGLVFPLLRWHIPGFLIRTYLKTKKKNEEISKHIVSDGQM